MATSRKTSPKSPVAEHEDDKFHRVTFTVPPDVARILETAWRQHENIDGSLCKNKSNYIADLILRDLTDLKRGAKSRRVK